MRVLRRNSVGIFGDFWTCILRTLLAVNDVYDENFWCGWRNSVVAICTSETHMYMPS